LCSSINEKLGLHVFKTKCYSAKGRWYDIIVLNVHAPIENKDDDIKDSFYEEL
jgi:hypothetical protein